MAVRFVGGTQWIRQRIETCRGRLYSLNKCGEIDSTGLSSFRARGRGYSTGLKACVLKSIVVEPRSTGLKGEMEVKRF